MGDMADDAFDNVIDAWLSCAVDDEDDMADVPAPCGVTCNYCGKSAQLCSGSEVYPHRKDLWNRRFWVCKPCDARVGCHRGSITPLGRLANAELRKAKMEAHAAFDPLWRDKPRILGDRRTAYLWLARQLRLTEHECHIGMFDVERCAEVVRICKEKQLQHMFKGI